MNANFFKTALRQINRNKVYSAINIAGLAIGIACGFVIYKIISYESGFDKYHKNYTNIYRLINRYNLPNEGITYFAGQVHPLGEAVRNEFPGINAAMTFYAKEGQVSVENENGYQEKYLENEGLAFAEPEIFEIFDFKFIAGNPENAISNTESIVITSSLAQKYFKLNPGEVGKALGKSVKIDNKTTFTVTGILADTPENTDLPFKMIAGYRDQTTSNPYFNNGTDWKEYNSATNCYLLLPDDIDAADFETQLASFFVKYNGNDSPIEQKYVLQPLSEMHSGNCENYNNRQVPKKRLLMLGVIGLFILSLASINFINLSTAQASKRFKEIGVRKISGVSKAQLIFQFMGETVLFSFIAASAGLFISYFLMDYLENIIGYRLDLDILNDSGSLIYLLLSTIAIGIISGFYPAIILSRMNPIGNLKNTYSSKISSGSVNVRRVLVITQFTVSLLLITGTLVMNKQMNYFLGKDLGFKKDAILITSLPNADEGNLRVLKSNLLNYAEINKVSYSTRSPMADWRVGNAINYPTLEKDTYSGNLKCIDEDYLDLFQLKLIAGENIDERKGTGDAIVNRKLTKLLGFDDPHDAVGEIFTYGRNALEFKIAGVVEDFHAQSLQQELDNVILSNLPFNIYKVAVKINPVTANMKGYNQVIEKIQKEWSKVFPDDIFDYKLLDQQIAAYYSEEAHTFKLIQLFAFIAILIGALGLYGLILFIANQKIKEIGIRKVNGAKIIEVVTMLNKDFVKWIAVAFTLATPIAYYAMNKWLENFAYKTSLSWWIFILAGLLALGIALLTVSWQSWRAATRNPVEALRYE